MINTTTHLPSSSEDIEFKSTSITLFPFKVNHRSETVINFVTLSDGISWFPPNGWTGPYPALYWNFDTTEHMTLMEGTQEGNFAALMSGKVILLNCKKTFFGR